MNHSDFDKYNNDREREPNSLVEQLSEELLDRKQQSAYGQAIAEKNYINAKLKETLKELSDLKFALDKAAIVAITDRQGIITYVNKTFCEISKYSKEELIGKTHRIIKSGYHSREFFRELWHAIGTGQVWKGEVKNKAKDGSYYWVDTTIVPFLNDRGIPDRYLAIRFDISDRKLAEEALRESEAKNRGLIDAIPDVMFRLNRQGIFLDYFPAKDKRNARSPQEFIGKNIFEVFSHHLAERTIHYLGQAIEMQIPQLHEYMVKRDREWHHYEVRYVPCGEKEVLAIVRDDTERRSMEEALRKSEQEQREKALEIEVTLQNLKKTQSQLIQAEKMSSLGQLVAGIAHEINNPVNFIYGNLIHASEYIQNLLHVLQLYMQHYDPPLPEIETTAEELDLDFLIEDLPQMVGSMKLGANRIREIVLSLRNFSRLDEAEAKEIDIHSGIESTLVILQSRLKANGDNPEIKIIKEYGNLPKLECYASQLNQVFMNLIANAIDALEECWATEPVTANLDNRNPTIWIKTRTSNDGQAVVEIADNGPGIPESVQQRLFDPFFTTKPVGKGTGLGLSIAYHIVVEKHKGKLECISHRGAGTKFEISIPISSKK